MSWLHRIAEHFERSVWINPEDTPYCEGSHTACIIKRLETRESSSRAGNSLRSFLSVRYAKNV